MCELCAINSLKPVRANEYLRTFFQDSVAHPHGWGLSWRDGQQVFLHKEELRAIDSSYLSRLLDEPICTSRVVAHIRNATIGTLKYNNCHPFRRTDQSGTEWVIAHNGTLLDSRLIDGYGAFALGDTDSEQLVICLIDKLDELIERKGAPLTFGERFVVLAHAIEELSCHNKLNLVLDDGEYTYLHTNTQNPTLYVRVDGDTAYFCTRALTDDEGWVSLPSCRLIAYRNGRMERIGARHGFSIDEEAYLREIRAASDTAQ